MDKFTVHNPGIAQPLKVGVMCNGSFIHHWQQKCLEELMTLEGVTIEVIIKNVGKGKKTGSLLKRIQQKSYRLLMKLSKPRGYQPIAIENMFGETAVLSIEPEMRGKFTDVIKEADIQQIKSHQLDFIIRFGFRILQGEILNAAKYGVWSYHHGDEKNFRGGPAGFWEIVKGVDMTGAILQRLTSKIDGGIILKKGQFKTIHHSFQQQVDQLLYGTASWVKQVCLELQNNNDSKFRQPEVGISAPINVAPGVLSVLLFSIKLLWNRMKFHKRSLLNTEYWNIGVVNESIESFTQIKKVDGKVDWLALPKSGKYNADPFGFIHNGQQFVVFEQFDYRKHQATIKIAELTPELQLINEKELGPFNAHVSYPCIVEHEGVIYMIPESKASETVELYTLNPELGTAKHLSTLVKHERLIDNTLFHHDNHWWLFCTSDELGSNHSLMIYYADKITGPYLPHIGNPVKTDITSARPAGNPFKKDGKLFRPTQNSAKSYGAGIALMEIVTLNTTAFEEKLIQAIGPDLKSNHNKGIHTLSKLGNKTLVDGKRYRFDFHNFTHQLKKKLKL